MSRLDNMKFNYKWDIQEDKNADIQRNIEEVELKLSQLKGEEYYTKLMNNIDELGDITDGKMSANAMWKK